MLKIRLKRCGRKKQPSYRIVVIDSRKKRDGRAIEEVGFYNPLTNQARVDMVQINKKLKEGAQPTEVVQNIIRRTTNI
uniref:ribosomal protein S16 n=1 Tax=Gloiopeltis furcata TaxID=42017 RepID=UPI0028D2AF5C|nr:ribosomal protein S16 [Gloiopeltis furcata]WMP13978.1 ribosomal protein S16 [Gloiopeltis furcata]